MSILTAPRPEERATDGAGRLSRILWDWVSRVTQVLGGKQPLQLAAYTVAGLPDADKWGRCIVVVTNEAGGEIPAWSDGTSWRRVSDGAVVS